MEIKEPIKRQGIENEKKLSDRYLQFEKLIIELKKREIPFDVVNSINQEIEVINSFSGSNKDLLKQLRRTQSIIMNLIEKELKLVPRNHYRNTWLAVGMAVFGIPLGVVFGVGLGNMALLAIGLPIGMAIGMAIGAGMDKKAIVEGRQLDLEIEN